MLLSSPPFQSSNVIVAVVSPLSWAAFKYLSWSHQIRATPKCDVIGVTLIYRHLVKVWMSCHGHRWPSLTQNLMTLFKYRFSGWFWPILAQFFFFFFIYSLPHTLPYFLHLISILTEHRNTLASVCFAEIHHSKFLHATLCAIYQLNKSLDKKKNSNCCWHVKH